MRMFIAPTMTTTATTTLPPPPPSPPSTHLRCSMMIPSKTSPLPMSLAIKSSSSEKLNELIMADQDSESMAGSDQTINQLCKSIQYWLTTATEQHRKRLSIQLKKNWLRLVVSITVVIVQFIWFASYYIGLNTADTYSDLLAIQTGNIHHQPNSIPSIRHSIEVQDETNKAGFQYSIQYPLVDSVIINMSAATLLDETEPEQKISKQTDSPGKNVIKHCDPGTMFLQQQTEPWPSLLWRVLLGIKLAFMMIGLELVRLFDTIWETFRKPKSNPDDEKNRKSFIDLSYIERNRGYK